MSWVTVRLQTEGQNEPRRPARNPAAHPPTAPFTASSFCRWFATTDSVKANVAPMAAVRGLEREVVQTREGLVPKNPMVPPVLVRNPAAPWEWVARAFWTVLTNVPTAAACSPTLAAYCSDGFGSYTGAGVEDMAVAGFRFRTNAFYKLLQRLKWIYP